MNTENFEKFCRWYVTVNVPKTKGMSDAQKLAYLSPVKNQFDYIHYGAFLAALAIRYNAYLTFFRHLFDKTAERVMSDTECNGPKAAVQAIWNRIADGVMAAGCTPERFLTGNFAEMQFGINDTRCNIKHLFQLEDLLYDEGGIWYPYDAGPAIKYYAEKEWAAGYA